MTPETTWPDWYLDPTTAESVRESMRELARYTNFTQTVRQGLGLGATGLPPAAPRQRQAVALAEQVIARRVRYTVEPFNPGGGRGQIIRTTQELLDGAGTCVDFAVTMAALLNRERIAPVLAVAIPTDESAAHAFVLVGDHAACVESASYAEWHALLSAADSAWLVLDLTPKPDDPTGDLAARRAATLAMLQGEGTVYTVDVGSAVAGPGFHLPPPAYRDLGVTAFLPDPAATFVEFPSHAGVRANLATAAGRVLLVGSSGTGKSTLALDHAGQVNDRRGWFLNGSDEDTLRLELAAAEAQSRGEERGSTDKDNVKTGASRALQRLARSDRPWVVVVDNANVLTDGVLTLLPVPRPATEERRADLLVVTSTDEPRAEQLTERGWTVERLRPLVDADAGEVGAVWSLLGEKERLPGLVRIATWCRDELDDGPATDSGPDRIVRAALRKAAAKPDTADMVAAVGAAAFMPAEQITGDWVARSAFEGRDDPAAAALGVAERAGLVERSRTDGLLGEHPPLWMHRLVRTAVQEQVDPVVGLRTLAGRRDEKYGRDEIGELDGFVTRNGPPKTRDGVLAAATVVDLWEGRGLGAVTKACELAKRFVDLVSKVDGLTPEERVSAYVRGQLAVAREASHGKPDDAQLADGIARCVDAAGVIGPLIDAWPEALLLRGRVDAMHGILLRGQAKRIPSGVDDAEKLRRSREAVAILEQSYDGRRRALRDSEGRPLPDPDHHIDRAWYNWRAAYTTGAMRRHERPPPDAGVAAVARELHEAMKAYAGSLSLRRGEPTNYTAASLWGVALAAYGAALYCPGRLDLTGVVDTEELAGVRARQDRTSLLDAAEHCCSAALDIWKELSGSPNNAREVLLKILLARRVHDRAPDVRARQFVAVLQDALKDLELATAVDLRVAAPQDEVTV